MAAATISQDEEGQTIHLPRAYRFAGSRVYVKRVGNAVLRLPHDAPYSVLLASLDEFSDDFMAERDQPFG